MSTKMKPSKLPKNWPLSLRINKDVRELLERKGIGPQEIFDTELDRRLKISELELTVKNPKKK
jgi:hypothetical protein